MIIWVNGPFGGGKSSVAAELLHQIPQATLYDPEEVGFMLRNLLPGGEADFQDLAPWRPLVAATALELISYTGGPLITPMSLLREDYAKEIFTPLRTHGTTVQHVVLHADRDTIIKRIHEDHTHSDTTRAFRLSKLDDYLHAYTTWLTDTVHVIDTRHVTASEAANQIAKLATSRHE
jgi:gluconate kinase